MWTDLISQQTSSLHRKELESGLEPMSTTLDALMVMHEMQDKQIDDNLAEMKRQQILTKDLLEGNVPLMLTAGIIPPSLSVCCSFDRWCSFVTCGDFLLPLWYLGKATGMAR